MMFQWHHRILLFLFSQCETFMDYVEAHNEQRSSAGSSGLSIAEFNGLIGKLITLGKSSQRSGKSRNPEVSTL